MKMAGGQLDAGSDPDQHPFRNEPGPPSIGVTTEIRETESSEEQVDLTPHQVLGDDGGTTAQQKKREPYRPAPGQRLRQANTNDERQNCYAARGPQHEGHLGRKQTRDR
jgi:hypothetical protein